METREINGHHIDVNETVYYDSIRWEWRGVNGEPVCQDHGHLMPCPHH